LLNVSLNLAAAKLAPVGFAVMGARAAAFSGTLERTDPLGGCSASRASSVQYAAAAEKLSRPRSLGAACASLAHSEAVFR
jgi:hypothetical protein